MAIERRSLTRWLVAALVASVALNIVFALGVNFAGRSIPRRMHPGHEDVPIDLGDRESGVVSEAAPPTSTDPRPAPERLLGAASEVDFEHITRMVGQMEGRTRDATVEWLGIMWRSEVEDRRREIRRGLLDLVRTSADDSVVELAADLLGKDWLQATDGETWIGSSATLLAGVDGRSARALAAVLRLTTPDPRRGLWSEDWALAVARQLRPGVPDGHVEAALGAIECADTERLDRPIIAALQEIVIAADEPEVAGRAATLLAKKVPFGDQDIIGAWRAAPPELRQRIAQSVAENGCRYDDTDVRGSRRHFLEMYAGTAELETRRALLRASGERLRLWTDSADLGAFVRAIAEVERDQRIRQALLGIADRVSGGASPREIDERLREVVSQR